MRYHEVHGSDEKIESDQMCTTVAIIYANSSKQFNVRMTLIQQQVILQSCRQIPPSQHLDPSLFDPSIGKSPLMRQELQCTLLQQLSNQFYVSFDIRTRN